MQIVWHLLVTIETILKILRAEPNVHEQRSWCFVLKRQSKDRMDLKFDQELENPVKYELPRDIKLSSLKHAQYLMINL